MTTTTITVTNQKGGVGKTTTALSISAGLALKNYKVLLIDLDSQINLTASLPVEIQKDSLTSAKILLEVNPAPKTLKTEIKNIDIIPGEPLLAGIERINPDITSDCLKKYLSHFNNKYNYIIIDTPPSLSILTLNALMASDKVLIPTMANYLALQGTGQLMQTIHSVKENGNPNLDITAFILTKFKARTILARQMKSLLEEPAVLFNTQILNTEIRECIAIQEAQAMKQDIFSYAPNSNAAEDYGHVIDELLAKKLI